MIVSARMQETSRQKRREVVILACRIGMGSSNRDEGWKGGAAALARNLGSVLRRLATKPDAQREIGRRIPIARGRVPRSAKPLHSPRTCSPNFVSRNLEETMPGRGP